MSDLSIRGGVNERDIDLLLAEELWANEPFARWFIAAATGSGDSFAGLIAVVRGETEFSGESDLRVDWTDSHGRPHRLQVENKIAAAFQPFQAERYESRARRVAGAGVFAQVKSILVAPESYLGSNGTAKGFDGAVTYEAIRAWLATNDPGRRTDFKLLMLDGAIKKASFGYQAVPDGAATAFWNAYYELASREAPELGMNRPNGGRPSGSYWIYFKPPGIPRGIKLLHKLTSGQFANAGCIALQLDGCGERYAEARGALAPLLPEDTEIRRTGASCTIELPLAEIRMTMAFAPQLDLVRQALRAASRMREWAMENRSALESIVG